MFQKVAEEIIKKALPMYMAKNTQYLKEAQIDKNDDVVNLIAKFLLVMLRELFLSCDRNVDKIYKSTEELYIEEICV